MLTTIKKLITNSTDEILNVYIAMVTEEIKNYCNLTSIPDSLEYTAIQMVVHKFNQTGSEGLSSSSYSGVSESYLNGYSQSIVSSLNRHKKLRLI